MAGKGTALITTRLLCLTLADTVWPQFVVVYELNGVDKIAK